MTFIVSNLIELPIDYRTLQPWQRRKVREQYIENQGGNCSHCNEPLSKSASKKVMEKEINMQLFPENFFKYPVHLHHSHDTGMTIGAVHCHCNAVLWQYHGE